MTTFDAIALGYMVTYFNNIDIKAWDSDGSCPTSCGGFNFVELDGNATTYQRYPDRIAHELGHVASDQSSVSQFAHRCGAGNYPTNLNVGGGWTMTSAEWGCHAWEEGFATFIGDVGRVWWNATSPATFQSQTSYGLETNADSSGCATDENRRPLTVDRLLWDMYDSGSDDGDTVSRSYDELVDGNRLWGLGTGNRERDEAHNGTGAGAAVVDGDGKSVYDYRWNYWDALGISTQTIWTNQCSPPGD